MAEVGVREVYKGWAVRWLGRRTDKHILVDLLLGTSLLHIKGTSALFRQCFLFSLLFEQPFRSSSTPQATSSNHH